MNSTHDIYEAKRQNEDFETWFRSKRVSKAKNALQMAPNVHVN